MQIVIHGNEQLPDFQMPRERAGSQIERIFPHLI